MLRKVLLVASVAVAGAVVSQCSGPSTKCDATTCPNGCCDPTQTDFIKACSPGTGANACGKAGSICSTCSAGTICSANACVTGSAGGGTASAGGGSSSAGGGTASTGGGTGATG